jgi:hypothetical protein
MLRLRGGDTITPEKVRQMLTALRKAHCGPRDVTAIFKAQCEVAELPAAASVTFTMQDALAVVQVVAELLPQLDVDERVADVDKDIDALMKGSPKLRERARIAAGAPLLLVTPSAHDARHLRVAALKRAQLFAKAAAAAIVHVPAHPTQPAPVTHTWTLVPPAPALLELLPGFDDEGPVAAEISQVLAVVNGSESKDSVAINKCLKPFSLKGRGGSLHDQINCADKAIKHGGGKPARARLASWKRIQDDSRLHGFDMHVYVFRFGSNTDHRLGLLFHLPTRRFIKYASFRSEHVTLQEEYVPPLEFVKAFRNNCLQWATHKA